MCRSSSIYSVNRMIPKNWIIMPQPARSIEEARGILRSLGFRRAEAEKGPLVDSAGQRVSFSILVSAANPARTEMATIIQADLEELGIEATIQPLETRAIVDQFAGA